MMETDIFQMGEPQTITDVLKNKDHRARAQQELENDFPDSTILSVKLNMPGPVKNTPEIERLFNLGLQRFMKEIKDRKIIKKVGWDEPTGSERFLVVEQSGSKLKKTAVHFEDTDELGRLFDVDVLDQRSGHYSRSDLGLSSRNCFICSKNAKECARNRTHSVEELQQKINQIYAKAIEDD